MFHKNSIKLDHSAIFLPGYACYSFRVDTIYKFEINRKGRFLMLKIWCTCCCCIIGTFGNFVQFSILYNFIEYIFFVNCPLPIVPEIFKTKLQNPRGGTLKSLSKNLEKNYHRLIAPEATFFTLFGTPYYLQTTSNFFLNFFRPSFAIHTCK